MQGKDPASGGHYGGGVEARIRLIDKLIVQIAAARFQNPDFELVRIRGFLQQESGAVGIQVQAADQALALGGGGPVGHAVAHGEEQQVVHAVEGLVTQPVEALGSGGPQLGLQEIAFAGRSVDGAQGQSQFPHAVQVGVAGQGRVAQLAAGIVVILLFVTHAGSAGAGIVDIEKWKSKNGVLVLNHIGVTRASAEVLVDIPDIVAGPFGVIIGTVQEAAALLIHPAPELNGAPFQIGHAFRPEGIVPGQVDLGVWQARNGASPGIVVGLGIAVAMQVYVVIQGVVDPHRRHGRMRMLVFEGENPVAARVGEISAHREQVGIDLVGFLVRRAEPVVTQGIHWAAVSVFEHDALFRDQVHGIGQIGCRACPRRGVGQQDVVQDEDGVRRRPGLVGAEGALDPELGVHKFSAVEAGTAVIEGPKGVADSISVSVEKVVGVCRRIGGIHI